MGVAWQIVREEYPLSDLTALAKATGGASVGWHVAEPSVGQVQDSAGEDGRADNDSVIRLVEGCTLDADGAPVFADGGNRFRDLPAAAAKELSAFVLDKCAPEEDDADEGKPPGDGSTS